jgi:filamentous hemagglutinin family protein
MNRIYRLVWNPVHKLWAPVAEIARGRSKGSSRKLFAAALSLTATVVHSEPIDGQIVSGSGSITQSGTTTTIQQNSQNMSANWQSFNIAPAETVNFQQPNTAAIAVNRIADTNGTQILGHLNANGQVYLINPNGILFGQGAQVNVGGLVASTLDVKDASLNSNNRTFSGSGTGSVINKGTLTAANGGSVALIGNTVNNQGTITAQLGTVALGAGSAVTLTFNGNNLVQMQVDQSVLNSLAENKQLIQTDGGQVIMTAGAQNTLLASVVNNEGVIEARSVENHNGVITLGGDMVINTGTVGASGSHGGTVEVTGRSLLQAGAIHADGTAGDGGSVTLKASGALIQTAAGEITANAAGQGGGVKLASNSSTYLSGTVSANGENGGRITATAPQLTLAATTIEADGQTQGGALRLGGGAHGANPGIANAVHTLVNPSTTLSAQGRQGKIVVWADDSTGYYGNAKTGPEGFIEVSGKQTLNYGGQADPGAGGNLLLDPANLIIDASAPAMFYFDLANPDPAANEQHGSGGIKELTNGNIVVATPADTFGGAAAGAVYLYSGSTGALLSTLVGSTASDQVGSSVTALSNGNYVVGTSSWDNGAIVDAGATTWGSGVTGISGVISSANSLVGSTASDQVGNAVTKLSNDNYVVGSYLWSNGAGAATWGNGTTGISGVVSSANSLVGSTANDFVGLGITALSNGNYVTRSAVWDNGAIVDAGAATWGSGTTGISGVVSSANSLVGSTANDQVSNAGITALSNGNYVVGSSSWDNGAIANAGAATWGSGTTGISGVVSSANSLVGSTANDQVGFVVTALSNGGNYVVGSKFWDNGAIVDAGAATWGSGATGISGVVSSANSLVGSTANDNVGQGGVTVLSNGNYVVSIRFWDNGAIVDAGAATWGSGATGISGVISSANSLVGSTASDQVASAVTVLSNGNYVVGSKFWDNGAIANAGAATWGSGTTGISGVVSSANSLVGSTANDNVGITVTALSNGNYVVGSSSWDNGATVNVGAATWGSGTTGISGVISSANSLIGSTAGDAIGNTVTALSNGSYVVSSNLWDNDTIVNAGAATWGSGTTGISGVVSSANSLVGSRTGDAVSSSGITALSNGNYLVRSTAWDNSTTANVGAVTWGSGTTGISGVVSSANSLVGSTAGDAIGNTVTKLSNGGNYVVGSSSWDNGAIANAGAATWGSGTAGIIGVVSSANSLVGSTANDQVGIGGITALSNGNYVVGTSSWDNGAIVNAGAAWLVVDPANLPTLVNNLIVNPTLSPTAIAAAAASGTVTLQTSNNITVNSAINVAGRLNLVAGNALTLNAGITSTATGDALQLAGQSFTNNVGAGALTTPNGRWLVWSGTPANDTRNGLGYNFKQYNATYGSSTVLGSGNGFLYTAAPVVTASLTGSVSKVYDTSLTATLAASNYATSGALDGDTVILNNPTSGAYNNKNVAGGKNVAVTGVSIASANNGAATVYGYHLAGNSINANIGAITPKSLTVTGLTAGNKVYDGTTNATVGTGSAILNGLFSGESVNVSATGTFSDKNAGAGKTVILSSSYSGADVNNYNINSQSATTADIAKANLFVTGLTANNKVYDATTIATLSGTPVVSALGADSVMLGGTASGAFADRNVGTGKPVTVNGFTLSGADAGNYNLVQQTGLKADITKANLVVTGVTAKDKVYDTNMIATLDGAAAVAPLSGDEVGIGSTGSGVFADANVGTDKAVTVSGFTLKGTDAGNYNVVQPAGLTANITAAPSTTDSGRPPEPVRNVTSLLTASLTSSPTSTQPGTVGQPSSNNRQSPDQPSFNNDNQGSGQNAVGQSSGNRVGENTTMAIGENGLTVNIENGGVNLLGNRQPNKKDSDEL